MARNAGLVRERKPAAARTQRLSRMNAGTTGDQLRLGERLLKVQRVRESCNQDWHRGSFLHSEENLTYTLIPLEAPEKTWNFINEVSSWACTLTSSRHLLPLAGVRHSRAPSASRTSDIAFTSFYTAHIRTTPQICAKISSVEISPFTKCITAASGGKRPARLLP